MPHRGVPASNTLCLTILPSGVNGIITILNWCLDKEL